MSGPYLRTNKEIFYTTINILSHFTKKNENILPYTNYNCFLQFFFYIFKGMQEGWSPPTNGWVVFNTDGAGNSEHRYGCGGLIRGSSGEWLGGFAKGLGDCSIEAAELWGAWEGLKLAWNLEFNKVEHRLVALNVVKILNREKVVTDHFGWNMCKRIWRLMELDWEVQIRQYSP
jgi:ribonuclease HI